MRKMREKILWLIAQRKIKTATAMLSNSVGKGAISDEEFKFLNKKIKVAVSKKNNRVQNFPTSVGKRIRSSMPNGHGHQ